jgi:hypothetical protein
MKVWEDVKLGFNPADCQDHPARKQRMNLSGLLGGGVLGRKTLQECVDMYDIDLKEVSSANATELFSCRFCKCGRCSGRSSKKL